MPKPKNPNLNSPESLFLLYDDIRTYLKDPLLSPTYDEKLEKLYHQIPFSDLVNLEIRLDGNQQVDVNVIYREADIKPLLDWYSKQMDNDGINLIRLVQEWKDHGSFIHNVMNNIWLMYDFGIEHKLPVTPWIILTLATKGFPADLIRDLYEKTARQLTHEIGHEEWDSFENLLLKMPEHLSIPAVGLLSRGHLKLRFGLHAFHSMEEVIETLSTLGWEGKSDFLKFHYTWPVDNAYYTDIGLTIDNGQLVKNIGLECFLDKTDNYRHTELYLDFLIDQGWCLPGYMKALLDFIGEHKVSADLLPMTKKHLVNNGSVVVERWVSHFKMVYKADGPPAAKAYLIYNLKF
ncbi:hypothetical protein [Portibacter marinus]|uniref:hypothetical protein n=1 Tax=Portibacter marinus TaxID=2898660 RepID=UPI001F24070F|nr:hypothetical protein [Portibacter marinus]